MNGVTDLKNNTIIYRLDLEIDSLYAEESLFC